MTHETADRRHETLALVAAATEHQITPEDMLDIIPAGTIQARIRCDREPTKAQRRVIYGLVETHLRATYADPADATRDIALVCDWPSEGRPVHEDGPLFPLAEIEPAQPVDTILTQHVTDEFRAAVTRLHPTATATNPDILQGFLAGAVSDQGIYGIVNMFLDDRRIVHRRATGDGTYQIDIVDDVGLNTYETANAKIRSHAASMGATLVPLSAASVARGAEAARP